MHSNFGRFMAVDLCIPYFFVCAVTPSQRSSKSHRTCKRGLCAVLWISTEKRSISSFVFSATKQRNKTFFGMRVEKIRYRFNRHLKTRRYEYRHAAAEVKNITRTRTSDQSLYRPSYGSRNELRAHSNEWPENGFRTRARSSSSRRGVYSYPLVFQLIAREWFPRSLRRRRTVRTKRTSLFQLLNPFGRARGNFSPQTRVRAAWTREQYVCIAVRFGILERYARKSKRIVFIIFFYAVDRHSRSEFAHITVFNVFFIISSLYLYNYYSRTFLYSVVASYALHRRVIEKTCINFIPLSF